MEPEGSRTALECHTVRHSFNKFKGFKGFFEVGFRVFRVFDVLGFSLHEVGGCCRHTVMHALCVHNSVLVKL